MRGRYLGGNLRVEVGNSSLEVDEKAVVETMLHFCVDSHQDRRYLDVSVVRGSPILAQGSFQWRYNISNITDMILELACVHLIRLKWL